MSTTAGRGEGRLIRFSKGSKKGERSHISREEGRGKSIWSQRGQFPFLLNLVSEGRSKGRLFTCRHFNPYRSSFISEVISESRGAAPISRVRILEGGGGESLLNHVFPQF